MLFEGKGARYAVSHLLINLSTVGAAFCVISYSAQRLKNHRASTALRLVERLAYILAVAIMLSD